MNASDVIRWSLYISLLGNILILAAAFIREDGRAWIVFRWRLVMSCLATIAACGVVTSLPSHLPPAVILFSAMIAASRITGAVADVLLALHLWKLVIDSSVFRNNQG